MEPTEVGREDGWAYGVKITLCRNAETLFGATEDSTGNGWNDEADAASDEFHRVLDWPEAIRQDRNFENWNGRRWARQWPNRSRYGVCVVDWYIAEIDGDTYAAWLSAELAEVPGAIHAAIHARVVLSVDAARAVIDAAIAEQESDIVRRVD